MQRRLDALQRAQERAKALEGIISLHAPKAGEIAEEKHQAQQVRAAADAARQVFRDWLGQTYRDPAAAEQAWQKSCREKGLKRTMREVGRNPERLGPLQGWRVWVFASAERREAERYAAGLVKKGAEVRILGGKAGAARIRLHQLGRQERDDPGLREYAHARGELGQRRSWEIGRAVHQAECDLVARWAKEIAVVGPGREPGKVTYEWAYGMGQAERERRESLFNKHQSHAKAELVREYQRRDPQCFRQWEQVRQAHEKQISQGRTR